MEKNRNEWTDLYPKRCSTFLNDWLADYETAKDHQLQSGGYLLVYKKYFFIVSKEYIETLGLDPDDPDWQLIDYDWARPADAEALERLLTKLLEHARLFQ